MTGVSHIWLIAQCFHHINHAKRAVTLYLWTVKLHQGKGQYMFLDYKSEMTVIIISSGPESLYGNLQTKVAT